MSILPKGVTQSSGFSEAAYNNPGADGRFAHGCTFFGLKGRSVIAQGKAEGVALGRAINNLRPEGVRHNTQDNMAQSLAKIIIHVVFSTKNREPVLSAATRKDLFAYIVGILNSLDCRTIAIDGTEDHVHMLIAMSKTISLSKMMEEMKGGSSRWLNSRDETGNPFAWQAGYGAFSVSESQIPVVVDYITRQEEHHRKTTFQEELVLLLKKHNIEFDERYLWT
jgi:REP element-mobilizing transposase RayT